MMRSIGSIGIAAVVCYATSACSGQSLSAPLDICTIAANIKAYSGKVVRVTAFIGVGAEAAALYDPKCRDGATLFSVVFQPKVQGKMRTLSRILKRERHALVTVEGTIHGGEPLQVDPNLPDWMKERFKGSRQKYGHLNSFDIEIEVQRVIEAKDVDDGRGK